MSKKGYLDMRKHIFSVRKLTLNKNDSRSKRQQVKKRKMPNNEDDDDDNFFFLL